MNEASSRTTPWVPGWRTAACAVGIAASLACVGPPPAASYQELLNHWQGENEADLVSAWGMPRSTHVLADGGRVLEYQVGEDDDSCTTRFTLDNTGKIVRWWYAGSGCSAPETG